MKNLVLVVTILFSTNIFALKAHRAKLPALSGKIINNTTYSTDQLRVSASIVCHSENTVPYSGCRTKNVYSDIDANGNFKTPKIKEVFYNYRGDWTYFTYTITVTVDDSYDVPYFFETRSKRELKKLIKTGIILSND